MAPIRLQIIIFSLNSLFTNKAVPPLFYLDQILLLCIMVWAVMEITNARSNSPPTAKKKNNAFSM